MLTKVARPVVRSSSYGHRHAAQTPDRMNSDTSEAFHERKSRHRRGGRRFTILGVRCAVGRRNRRPAQRAVSVAVGVDDSRDLWRYGRGWIAAVVLRRPRSRQCTNTARSHRHRARGSIGRRVVRNSRTRDDPCRRGARQSVKGRARGRPRFARVGRVHRRSAGIGDLRSRAPRAQSCCRDPGMATPNRSHRDGQRGGRRRWIRAQRASYHHGFRGGLAAWRRSDRCARVE